MKIKMTKEICVSCIRLIQGIVYIIYEQNEIYSLIINVPIEVL